MIASVKANVKFRIYKKKLNIVGYRIHLSLLRVRKIQLVHYLVYICSQHLSRLELFFKVH